MIMPPVFSDSPVKTTSSSRDQRDATKAKKSRMNEGCHPPSSSDTEGENEVKYKPSTLDSKSKNLSSGSGRRGTGNKTRNLPSRNELEVLQCNQKLGGEHDEVNIKGEPRSRSNSSASSAQDTASLEGDIRDGNKRSYQHSNSSRNDKQVNSKPPFELNYEQELDPSALARRVKQIEYGKNTPEYHNYTEAVPKMDRQPFHPRTPNMHRKYSRRAWDGLVRQWRMNLHCWSEYPISASQADEDEKSDNLNDSFHSEDTAISASTSSSVAAAFHAGIKIISSNEMKVEVKKEVSSDEENEEDYTGKRQPKKLMLDKASLPLAKVKKEVLGTSWADEVDEYLEDLK